MTSDPRPAVAAVVLAAGRSRRMGTVNKLLAPIAGQPLIGYAVAAACASSARPVIVVVGHEAAALRRVLGASPLTIVDNPGYAHGLAS